MADIQHRQWRVSQQYQHFFVIVYVIQLVVQKRMEKLEKLG